MAFMHEPIKNAGDRPRPFRIIADAPKRNPAFWWAYGLYVSGIALAFTIPGDIMRHEWAVDFVNVMERIVGRIGNIPAEPLAHPIAKFYHSIMWLLVSVCFLLVILIHGINRPPETVLGKERGGAVFFAILVILFVYFDPLIDSSHIGRATIRSRAGMGLIGGLIVACLLPFAFGIAVWIRNVPKIYRATHAATNDKTN